MPEFSKWSLFFLARLYLLPQCAIFRPNFVFLDFVKLIILLRTNREKPLGTQFSPLKQDYMNNNHFFSVCPDILNIHDHCTCRIRRTKFHQIKQKWKKNIYIYIYIYIYIISANPARTVACSKHQDRQEEVSLANTSEHEQLCVVQNTITSQSLCLLSCTLVQLQ
jgi:hypothetical protein